MHELAGQRVLMLLENSPYSGDGRVRREANTLAAAGCRVTVICRRGPGEGWRGQFGPVVAYQYPSPPPVDGFVGYALEYGYALLATMTLSLWVAVRSGFDVVHAHNPPDLFVLIGGFYKLFGKRFIFDQHDIAPEMYRARCVGHERGLVHRALLFFERLSCRWADHVIVANGSYQRLAVDRSGIPLERVTIVRNGPEPCHLQIAEPDASLRGGAEIVIGFVGEMGPQDGVDGLLRILSRLDREFPNKSWRCVLVGDGDSADSLRRLARELGIDDRLCFTGWLDYREVPRYIGAMDICTAPDPSNAYTDRSTIIKLMEYMAQGKPVVAFDLPEHRVTAGDAALYAAINDEADFARQLARLMDDGELRERLGQSGRERVVSHLAWRHQEGRLLAAYRQVASRRLVRQDIAETKQSP
jgi:glycosyltransferase involved in cell wall biosynthesis